MKQGAVEMGGNGFWVPRWALWWSCDNHIIDGLVLGRFVRAMLSVSMGNPKYDSMESHLMKLTSILPNEKPMVTVKSRFPNQFTNGPMNNGKRWSR